MARPNVYNRVSDKVETNGIQRQLVGSKKMWGLQHKGEWIVEVRLPSWIGGIYKYTKCFYPTIKAAQAQQNKYIKRFGLQCEVVQLQQGGSEDGENE